MVTTFTAGNISSIHSKGNDSTTPAIAVDDSVAERETVRVLVIDDDEDDYLIAHELLAEIGGPQHFVVDWIPEPTAGLSALEEGRHDVCLLDYRLGRYNGLDLLRQVVARGISTPIILLTGQEDGDVDREAVRIGASDYLVKGRINSILLDRAIRYARQQRQTLEALRQQTEFVSAVLDTAGALVVVLDREGRIVRFNRQCERTTGYTVAEVMGRVIWDFLLADDERDAVKAVVADLLAGNGANQFENDWVTRTGERRRIAWSNTYLFGTDGMPEFLVSTGIDVTERRAAEEALQLAREREVEVGANIQKTLLVRKPLADLPGLEFGAHSMASQKIGGDYFDFFHFSESVVDVLVGDVMGKGVPAALLAAATKAHFQRVVRRLGYVLAPYNRLPEPEEVVAAVHANLTSELVGLNSFVTLAYARFDLKAGTVTFVDCGHPRPLRVTRGAGDPPGMLRCERISGDNMPLGMYEAERYEQRTVPLQPGDLFFFYSDGLSEAPDAQDEDELFGEDRLADAVTTATARGLGAAEVTQEVVRVVREFSGAKAVLADDLTCLAVKIRPWDAPYRTVTAYLELTSDADQLEKMRDFASDFCQREVGDCIDEDTTDLLVLALNEAVANVMEHSYKGKARGHIQLEAQATCSETSVSDLRFRLYDSGEAFTGRESVPLPSFDGTRDNGFGVFIIQQCFDTVEYTRDGMGRNCLTMVKNLAKVRAKTDIK